MVVEGYTKDSLVFNKQDDLSFNSAGDVVSCFVELVNQTRKWWDVFIGIHQVNYLLNNSIVVIETLY